MNLPLNHCVTFVTLFSLCCGSARNTRSNVKALNTKESDALQPSLPPAEYFDNTDDYLLYDYDYYGDRAETDSDVSPSKLDKILPLVEFECVREGYFADAKFECEAFHYCSADGTRFTFLCGEGSKFNQRTLICDFDHALQCGDSDLHSSKSTSFDSGINSFSFEKQEITSEPTLSKQKNQELPMLLLNQSNTPILYHKNEPVLTSLKNRDEVVTPVSYEHILKDISQLVHEARQSKSSSSSQEGSPSDAIDAPYAREEHFLESINQGKTDWNNIQDNTRIFTGSSLRARSGRNIALEDQGLLAIRNMAQSSPWSDNSNFAAKSNNHNGLIYANKKPLSYHSNKQYNYDRKNFHTAPSDDGTLPLDESSYKKDNSNIGFFEQFPFNFDISRKFNAKKTGKSSPQIFTSNRVPDVLNWRGINVGKPLRHSSKHKQSNQIEQVAEASSNNPNLFRRNPNRRQTSSHQVSIDQLRQFQHELSVQRPPHFALPPPPPTAGPPPPLFPSVPPPPPHGPPLPPHHLDAGFRDHHNRPLINENQPFIEDSIRHNLPSNPETSSTFREDEHVRHTPPEVRNYHLSSANPNQFSRDPQEFFVTHDSIHADITPTIRPFHPLTVPSSPDLSPLPHLPFSVSPKGQSGFNFVTEAPANSFSTESITGSQAIIEENSHFSPSVVQPDKDVNIPHNDDGVEKSFGLVATKNELGYDTFVAPQFANTFNKFSAGQHHGNQPFSPHLFHKIPLPSLQPPQYAGISTNSELHGSVRAFEPKKEGVDLSTVTVTPNGQHLFESEGSQQQNLAGPLHPFGNPPEDQDNVEQNFNRDRDFHRNVLKQSLPQDASFPIVGNLNPERAPPASFINLKTRRPNPLFHHDSIFPTEVPLQYDHQAVLPHSEESILEAYEEDRAPNTDINNADHVQVFSKTSAPPPKITTPLPKIVVYEATTGKTVSSATVASDKPEDEVRKSEVESTTRPLKTNKRRRNRFRYRNRGKVNQVHPSNKTTSEQQQTLTSPNVQLKRLRSRRPSRRRRPVSTSPSHGTATESNDSSKIAPKTQASTESSSTSSRGHAASLRLPPSAEEVKSGSNRDFGSLRLRHRQKSSHNPVYDSNQVSVPESINHQAQAEQAEERIEGSEQLKLKSFNRNFTVPVLDRDFRRFGRKRHRIRLRNFIQNSTESVLGTTENTETEGSENTEKLESIGSTESSIGQWRRLRGKRRRFRNGNFTLRSPARHSNFPMTHKLSSVLPNKRVITQQKSAGDVQKYPTNSSSTINNQKLGEKQHEDQGEANEGMTDVRVNDEQSEKITHSGQMKKNGESGSTTKYDEDEDQKGASNKFIFKSESIVHSDAGISLTDNEQRAGIISLKADDDSSHHIMTKTLESNLQEQLKAISDKEKLLAQVVDINQASTNNKPRGDFDEMKLEPNTFPNSPLSSSSLEKINLDSSPSTKVLFHSTLSPASQSPSIGHSDPPTEKHLPEADSDLLTENQPGLLEAQSRIDNEQNIEYLETLPASSRTVDTPLLPLQSLFAGMR